MAEEIDWVVVGQGLGSVEEYLEFDRTGRGRSLGRQQRRHLWMLYEVMRDLLRRDQCCLFSERLKAAAEHVTPQYDYIFIDEAQDLKPVAIRFLMGLCHYRRNIFLTADTNQSIWGSGFSWTKMAEDLRVQGRARILRRNYRTTKENWQAGNWPRFQGADKETLGVDAVYHGSRPSCYKHPAPAGGKIELVLVGSFAQRAGYPGQCRCPLPLGKRDEHGYGAFGQEV